MPTCPLAPQRRDIINQSFIQKLESCPLVPDLPSSPTAGVTLSIKRLMPRPRFVELPSWRLSNEYATADASYHSAAFGPISDGLMKAFEDQNINDDSEGDLDGRKVKRFRHTSLLDGLPPRRASFAGAA